MLAIWSGAASAQEADAAPPDAERSSAPESEANETSAESGSSESEPVQEGASEEPGASAPLMPDGMRCVVVSAVSNAWGLMEPTPILFPATPDLTFEARRYVFGDRPRKMSVIALRGIEGGKVPGLGEFEAPDSGMWLLEVQGPGKTLSQVLPGDMLGGSPWFASAKSGRSYRGGGKPEGIVLAPCSDAEVEQGIALAAEDASESDE